MVKEDSGTGVDIVALPVVDRDPVSVDFGYAIGAAGIERGAFGLGNFADSAEHFAAAGLVETDRGIDDADSVQQAGNT